jgi:hypothetical protein
MLTVLMIEPALFMADLLLDVTLLIMRRSCHSVWLLVKIIPITIMFEIDNTIGVLFGFSRNCVRGA